MGARLSVCLGVCFCWSVPITVPFVRVQRVELRASSFVLEYIDGVKQFQEIPSQIFVSLECRFTRLNFVSLFFCRVVYATRFRRFLRL